MLVGVLLFVAAQRAVADARVFDNTNSNVEEDVEDEGGDKKGVF